MKTTYRDPETGWSVTREAVTNPQSGVEVIEETLTDPRTGEVYHGSRAASYTRPIAEWVQAIVETKELFGPSEGGQRHGLSVGSGGVVSTSRQNAGMPSQAS